MLEYNIHIMNKDKFIQRERAKAILRERKAQERIAERKKIWKVLKWHPLPWLVLAIALVYICEALKS